LQVLVAVLQLSPVGQSVSAPQGWPMQLASEWKQSFWLSLQWSTPGQSVVVLHGVEVTQVVAPPDDPADEHAGQTLAGALQACWIAHPLHASVNPVHAPSHCVSVCRGLHPMAFLQKSVQLVVVVPLSLSAVPPSPVSLPLPDVDDEQAMMANDVVRRSEEMTGFMRRRVARRSRWATLTGAFEAHSMRSPVR
jgi:hypothetical protein